MPLWSRVLDAVVLLAAVAVLRLAGLAMGALDIIDRRKP